MVLSPVDKVKKAIIVMLDSQPFFAHLSTAMNVIALKDEQDMAQRGITVPTACVDMFGNMYFYEPFIAELSQDEVTWVVCHETLHPALDHLTRLGGRQPEIANIAMDMVVNMLLAQNHMTAPKGVVGTSVGDDAAWVFVNGKKYLVGKVSERWWEDIYEELYTKLDKAGVVQKVSQLLLSQASGDGAGGTGKSARDGHVFGNGGGDGKEKDGQGVGFSRGSSPEMVRQEWAQRLAEAFVASKQRGLEPAGVNRYVEKLLKPEVRWQSRLRTALRPHISPTNMSYRRLHRKTIPLGVVFPAAEKEHMEVEVLIDTSGSIGQDELTKFVSECAGIASAAQHVRMYVTFCDAQVYEDARYEVIGRNLPKLLAMKPKGGGGTRMEAGLEFIKKKNRSVPVVIVLTDGYDAYAHVRRDFPFEVVWCLSKKGVTAQEHRKNCKYGVVVKLEGA